MLTGCCVCGLWARQKKSGDPEEVIYEEPRPAQVEAVQLLINDSYMAAYRETEKKSGDPEEVIYEEPRPAQVEAVQLQINNSYMAAYRETDDTDEVL